MDNFVSNIKKINEEINTLSEIYLINIKVANKQILVYYLYRIMCKYLNLFKLNSDESKIGEIFRILKIPLDYTQCVPLVNKLPNTEKNINLLVNKLIDIYEIMASKSSNLNQQGEKDKVKFFNELIESKMDIVKIKEELVLLSSLVPGLGILEPKPSENV